MTQHGDFHRFFHLYLIYRARYPARHSDYFCVVVFDCHLSCVSRAATVATMQWQIPKLRKLQAVPGCRPLGAYGYGPVQHQLDFGSRGLGDSL